MCIVFNHHAHAAIAERQGNGPDAAADDVVDDLVAFGVLARKQDAIDAVGSDPVFPDQIGAAVDADAGAVRKCAGAVLADADEVAQHAVVVAAGAEERRDQDADIAGSADQVAKRGVVTSHDRFAAADQANGLRVAAQYRPGAADTAAELVAIDGVALSEGQCERKFETLECKSPHGDGFTAERTHGFNADATGA